MLLGGGGFPGLSSLHMQPLTPVSEVSEPPESPLPYYENSTEELPPDREAEEEQQDEVEQEKPPAAVPFWGLFACADKLDWFLMVVASLASAADGVAVVLYVHFFGKIIELLNFEDSQRSQELFDKFIQHSINIIFIAMGAFATGWIEVLCWILTGERQTAVIRSKYIQVLLNQDMSFFDTYGNNGNIVSHFLSDVLIIQSALSEKVGHCVHNMATFFCGLVIGFTNCWQIALITLATGPFIIAGGAVSNIFLRKFAENIQDAYAEAATIAEQALSCIRTLYAFTNETLAKYSYATSLQATLRYGILISLVQGIGLGLTYGVAICSCALQFLVGRLLVNQGKASGGEIFAAVFAIILSGLGLNQATTNLYTFEQGRIAAYRLYEIISNSKSTSNKDGNKLVSVEGKIEFRNVYFSYPSDPEVPILSGFYLTVPARKSVALIGRNGSGKNSIIPLIERFYDPTLGEVLLDGENIKNMKLGWLRNQIGLVTHGPALLNLSVKDNIAYGRDNATLDQIEQAVKIANLHPFIASLRKGYDTKVGRNGLALTEEQKVKLSIARAVLSNPSIILLDEVSASLDLKAERAVQDVLQTIMVGRTTIIIAQCLDFVSYVDYIGVMDEGRLVEFGTHHQLLSLDGLYSELHRCEETGRPSKRMAAMDTRESSCQNQTDSSISNSFNGSLVPKMVDTSSFPKVESLAFSRAKQLNGIQLLEGTYENQEFLKKQSYLSKQLLKNDLQLNAADNSLSMIRQDTLGRMMQELAKIDVICAELQTSNALDIESPISLILTSELKKELSHSRTRSYSTVLVNEVLSEQEQHKKLQMPPSLWRLVELSSAEWLYALLGSVGAATFGFLSPLLAYVLALLITAYYRCENGHHQRYEVDKWCLIITSIGIVTVVANFLQHFYFGIMGEKMTERVKRMMFSAMLQNEVGWFDEEENAVDSLSICLANDATFVHATFTNRLSIIIQNGAAISIALLIGTLMERRWAFVALATVPVLILSAIAQKMWLSGFSSTLLDLHKKASLALEDALRNIYSVVAFCAGDKVIEVYGMQLREIYKQSFFHGTANGFAFGLSQFLLFACNALLLWYTAMSVKNGYIDLHLALKAYMVFSFVTFALIEPFGLTPYIFKRRKSLTSVFKIIDRVPKINPDDCSALQPANVYGSIEFKNVDFCYKNHPQIMVLNNFSLKVDAGQKVAVVGVSGSGKSTIISLIERFYDPVAGQIILDGRNIKSLNLRWLRNNLSLVQQEPVIFSTTVKENILYARHNATEAEIKEAARIANAHHFISSLPHGYDTYVGTRGMDLTTGQKQRIAIARVVLKNAPILLVDEAISKIETESSRVVQEALETLIIGNKTTILVAHRASMMRHVDKIVVIDGGQIVEQGTHDSLLAQNGLYFRIMHPHFAKGLRQHQVFWKQSILDMSGSVDCW